MKNKLFWAIIYPIIALVLMILGFVRDPLYFYGAIIIGFVAFYWIRKAWKTLKVKKKIDEIGKKFTKKPFHWKPRTPVIEEETRVKTFTTPSELEKPTPKRTKTPAPLVKKPITLIKKKQSSLKDYKNSDHPSKNNLILKMPKGIIEEIDGHRVNFDKTSHEIYKKWWLIDEALRISVNKDGYLVSQKGKGKHQVSFHRFIKEDEIDDLAEKMGCPKRDIHVHHKKPHIKLDNRESNLKVLHKDDHAREHGFDSWEEFQKYRNSR
jgi:hypothetical protein